MPHLIPIIRDEPISSVSARGTITSHPKDTNATILSYTNGGSDNVYVDVVRADGDTDAHYQLLLDTGGGDTIIEEQHSSIVNPTVRFEFPTEFILAPGDKLTVKVEHYYAPLADFSAAIFGHRK